MQILVQNQLVNISHLAPIVRQMTLDLRGGKQKRNARLEIRFSCHCYSRGPAIGEAIPLGMLVPDGSAHDPRNRIFCWVRYNHSLSLLQKIDSLIQNNEEVCRSRHHNFFSTTIVAQDRNGALVEIPYYIFISAKKKQDLGLPPKLDLFIESAYPDSPDIPSPQGGGALMPLSEMLGRFWDGRA